MDPRIVRPVHEEMSKPYRKDMSLKRGGDAHDSNKGYGDGGHGQTPTKNSL
jgi:CDGSH-type Zn-finger protein